MVHNSKHSRRARRPSRRCRRCPPVPDSGRSIALRRATSTVNRCHSYPRVGYTRSKRRIFAARPTRLEPANGYRRTCNGNHTPRRGGHCCGDRPEFGFQYRSTALPQPPIRGASNMVRPAVPPAYLRGQAKLRAPKTTLRGRAQTAAAAASVKPAPSRGTAWNPRSRARAAPRRISAAVATNPAWSATTIGVSRRLCT